MSKNCDFDSHIAALWLDRFNAFKLGLANSFQVNIMLHLLDYGYARSFVYVYRKIKVISNLFTPKKMRQIYDYIYMWKLLKGNVPNFSPPIQCHISARRLCSSGVVPTHGCPSVANLAALGCVRFCVFNICNA